MTLKPVIRLKSPICFLVCPMNSSLGAQYGAALSSEGRTGTPACGYGDALGGEDPNYNIACHQVGWTHDSHIPRQFPGLSEYDSFYVILAI